MKKRVFFIVAFFFSTTCLFAQITDGPYVSYKDRTGYVQTISNGVVASSTFRERKKSKVGLHVSPQYCLEGFDIRLQKSITSPPVEYPMPSKLLLFSDIEGEFCSFIELMSATGVIDEDKQWSFGKGHVVICGDLFDRGKDVTAYIWFLYSLEQQAKKNGGMVHVILGNHEIMNLSGDVRYVDAKYTEAAKLMNTAYMTLYSRDTELGRWLRCKNVIERVGDILCMHGGISQPVLDQKLSVSEINALCRPYYDVPMKSLPANSETEKIKNFFGSDSPFWYRGYFLEPKATEELIDNTLSFYKVSGIAVGHTVVDNITPLYNHKVLALDVNHHADVHQALLIEKDMMYRIDSKGVKLSLNEKK